MLSYCKPMVSGSGCQLFSGERVRIRGWATVRNKRVQLQDLRPLRGDRTVQQRDLPAAAIYPDLALIREQQRGMFQYHSGDSTFTGQARAVGEDAAGLHHQSGHPSDVEEHAETHRRNDNDVMSLEAVPVAQ